MTDTPRDPDPLARELRELHRRFLAVLLACLAVLVTTTAFILTATL